jgi:hypothetical protein
LVVVVGLFGCWGEVESYRPRGGLWYRWGGGMVSQVASRRAGGGGGGAGAGDGFLLELPSRFGRFLDVTCHHDQPKLDGRTDPTIVELAWQVVVTVGGLPGHKRIGTHKVSTPNSAVQNTTKYS